MHVCRALRSTLPFHASHKRDVYLQISQSIVESCAAVMPMPCILPSCFMSPSLLLLRLFSLCRSLLRLRFSLLRLRFSLLRLRFSLLRLRFSLLRLRFCLRRSRSRLRLRLRRRSRCLSLLLHAGTIKRTTQIPCHPRTTKKSRGT